VVRTFAQTTLTLVRNRDRARWLGQTELGGLLVGVTKAKAGAKRLRTLPSLLIWKSAWIEEWLMEEAGEPSSRGKRKPGPESRLG
jgi:hypothetical protein